MKDYLGAYRLDQRDILEVEVIIKKPSGEVISWRMPRAAELEIETTYENPDFTGPELRGIKFEMELMRDERGNSVIIETEEMRNML